MAANIVRHGGGCATLDYDGDGDLDVVLVANGGPARLLRNEGSGNRSLRLDVPAGSEVTVGDRRFYAAPPRGYLSQSEGVLTVGIGPADKIDRLTVRWPGKDAGTRSWTDLPAGRTHILTQTGPKP